MKTLGGHHANYSAQRSPGSVFAKPTLARFLLRMRPGAAQTTAAQTTQEPSHVSAWRRLTYTAISGLTAQSSAFGNT